MKFHRQARSLTLLIRMGAVFAVSAALGAFVFFGYQHEWTGFGPRDGTEGQAVPGKTLWDWLELLIVPIVLAAGAFLLDGSRRRSDQRLERDRQRQQVLDAFFSDISELLLSGGLTDSEQRSSARTLARTRTLIALRQLDGGRKAQLLQFLYEGGLIGSNPVIEMVGADLSGALLDEASLRGAVLRGVYFNGASIRRATLAAADLRGSSFSRVDFYKADLTNASLAQADLDRANFEAANLKNADLRDVDLSEKQKLQIVHTR